MNFWPKITAAIAAPLLLSGCLFLPGKFDANLKLMQGGEYEFTYVGEMQIFSGDEKDMVPPVAKAFNPEYANCSDYYGMKGKKTSNIYYDSWRDDDEYGAEEAMEMASDAAEAADAAADAVEAAADAASYDAMEDGNIAGEESFPRTVKRACTAAELKELEQREITNFVNRKEEYDQKSQAMASVFGGAIPGNDEALKRFAEKMRKYDGWDKIEYAGNNIFNVEYRASGNFDRYFAFPILNDAAMQYPFFQIIPRKNGELEIMTPAVGGSGSFMTMMMLGGSKGGRGKDIPIQEISGSFTLETDGEILVNNSADGYQSSGKVKTIRWTVENVTESPRALIRFK